MLQLGLRISEVCGLQWGDIDLNNREIHICRGVRRISDGSGKTALSIQSPKTKTSDRILPIPQRLSELLSTVYSQKKCKNTFWFLSGTEKRPVEPRCYRKSVHSYLAKAGVHDVNPHMLRHTFATTSTKTKYDQTLINGLLSGLGTVVGGLVDVLAWLLTFGGVDAGLRQTLTNILNARKNDPTALATGALAGRVIGYVEVSGCELTGTVSVQSKNNCAAGFVGYIEGKTQYDGLSTALGGLTTLLANILNLIPGLGLGDLITILLGNAIPVDKLIPTGYINAKIIDCHVEDLNGNLGASAKDKDYAGGFAGEQVGSIIENCSVTGSNYSVVAKTFAGGFVGLARDDVIEGTLSGALDIETKLPGMNPESLLLNCTLNNTAMNISGESYIGGFAGGLANVSAVNCGVTTTESLTVHATGNNAGGFAGIATLGWAANLGKGDTKDNLLGGVVDLVVKLLSSNPGATTSLLSLAGVNPSYILGCTVNAPLTVSGVDYSFEEDEVPGYTMTDSAYDEKTYHATITNTHHPRLPDTGSTGDWMFVIIGVGILLLALSVPRKRKGREEAQS